MASPFVRSTGGTATFGSATEHRRYVLNLGQGPARRGLAFFCLTACPCLWDAVRFQRPAGKGLPARLVRTAGHGNLADPCPYAWQVIHHARLLQRLLRELGLSLYLGCPALVIGGVTCLLTKARRRAAQYRRRMPSCLTGRVPTMPACEPPVRRHLLATRSRRWAFKTLLAGLESLLDCGSTTLGQTFAKASDLERKRKNRPLPRRTRRFLAYYR